MELIKRIWNTIKKHPIWTIAIGCFIACFINGYETKKFNILGFTFLALFLIALISPYIRKLRREKAEKKNADYLAKKIAEEINNKS